MGVIELDGHLVRELPPGALGLLETANNVVQRGGNPEVLLLQAKFLSSLEVVIGVQNSTDSLSSLLIRDRAFVVAVIELLEIKLSARGLA